MFKLLITPEIKGQLKQKDANMISII
ncbi:MAG: hypothetical protein RL618_1801, partial [Pseudomonadota bacterium]